MIIPEITMVEVRAEIEALHARAVVVRTRGLYLRVIKRGPKEWVAFDGFERAHIASTALAAIDGLTHGVDP